MTCSLPPELAPALRQRAEELLSTVRLLQQRPEHNPPGRDAPERQGRGACHVCHRTTGRMGGHHLIPGDDSTVVPVHPSCHRRLHRAEKRRAS